MPEVIWNIQKIRYKNAFSVTFDVDDLFMHFVLETGFTADLGKCDQLRNHGDR